MSRNSSHTPFARFMIACRDVVRLIEEGREWRTALRHALDPPFHQFTQAERAVAQTMVGFLRLLQAIEAHAEAHRDGRVSDGESDPRVGPGLRYLRSRYADSTLTLSDTARESNLSKWYFDRLLKQVTGAPFRHHLIEIRMGKAKELLETTRLEIKEVADKVGYKHVSHFSRHFKRRHGISATEYRKHSYRSKMRNRG